MTSEQHELEVTLLVLSQTPRRVIERLEALRGLGDTVLRATPEQALHDVYLDVPPSPLEGQSSSIPETDGRLASSGFGLRLRQQEHQWLLCLKRRGTREGLAVRRLELEGPVHDAELRQRIAVVAALPEIAALDPESSPLHAFIAAGFSILHERRTRRRNRTVVTAAGAPLALLAIDSVDYEIDGAHLWHHEVEIESLGETEAVQLDELARLLRQSCPRELRPWRPSKLRTGLALRSLVQRAGAKGLVGADGDLLPGTYDRILKQLRRVT